MVTLFRRPRVNRYYHPVALASCRRRPLGEAREDPANAAFRP
jgi:hypothetical protein